MFLTRQICVSCVLWVAAHAVVFGQEDSWPQWMGMERNNVWPAKNTLDQFPKEGPKVVWSAPVQVGYAGPAVVGTSVYIGEFESAVDVKVSNFSRDKMEGVERFKCLNAETGEEKWRQEFPTTYAISYPSGPRCTPVVEDNRVYFLGAEGKLLCLDTEKGSVVWKRELKEEYNTNSALWGYASHPLIDGDNLICVVGGEGSHTVAFDKMTGKEIWKNGTASEQGYVPPKIIEHAGVRQLILASPDFIKAVDPATGKELWNEKYEATSGSIIMTPIHSGNYLFIGGYSKRNLMLELDSASPGAKALFRDKPKLGLSPVNVQPFFNGDLIYGVHQSGELMAVEIPSGERLWATSQPVSDRPVGNATTFIVNNGGDKFFLFAETGELVIAKLTRKGYEELDRSKVIEPTNNAFGRPVIWCAPAFANGRMYVRNDEQCLCIELTK